MTDAEWLCRERAAAIWAAKSSVHREFMAMAYVRATLMACLFVCSIGVGAASAQSRDGPAQLILSMPRSSLPLRKALLRHAYDAIKKRSGQMATQVLPLTGAETWSVALGNVDAVRKAAARYGVVVDQVGADWNVVFRATPKDDDSKGCGLSTRVFADADEAFSVVHHECATMNYSVAHEIGHLIGARHELELGHADGRPKPGLLVVAVL